MPNRDGEERRKRVDKLKKILLAALLVLLVIPYILCAVVLANQSKLANQMEVLQQQMKQMQDAYMQATLQFSYQQDKPGSDSSSDGTAEKTEEYRQDSSAEPDFSFSPEAMLLERKQRSEDTAVDWAGDSDTEESAGADESSEENRIKVCLTFDDGPSIYTDDILDILKEYGISATFFVVGREDAHSLSMYKRIVEEGHTLGIHSYSHKYSEIYASKEAFVADYEKIRDLLIETTGITPTVYRFPGGSSNTVAKTSMQELAEYLKEEGVTYYDWNIASGDAGSTPLTAAQILTNSTSGILKKNTAMILLHDAGDKYSTVEALPDIIETILQMEGTCFTAIDENTPVVQHVNLIRSEERKTGTE